MPGKFLFNMNALQQNNNCGTQSYLVNDIPALKEIAIKYSGIGRKTIVVKK